MSGQYPGAGSGPAPAILPGRRNGARARDRARLGLPPCSRAGGPAAAPGWGAPGAGPRAALRDKAVER